MAAGLRLRDHERPGADTCWPTWVGLGRPVVVRLPAASAVSAFLNRPVGGGRERVSEQRIPHVDSRVHVPGALEGERLGRLP